MLFDILDHFSSPFADLDQASQFLHGLRGEFDVTNLSYWHIGTRGTKPAQAIWLSTYPEPYRTTYLERGLQRTDPAFVLSFARLLPTDWMPSTVSTAAAPCSRPPTPTAFRFAA